MQCPQCGAENPDSSTFCSLCLARFTSRAEGTMTSHTNVTPLGPQVAPPTPPAPQNPVTKPEYVSPGDYHSLAREMYQSPYPPMPPVSSYGNTPYNQAALGYPGIGSAVPPPPLVSKRNGGGEICFL